MRRAVPRLMAVMMLGLLLGSVWGYSRYMRMGDIIFTNQDICGNMDSRSTRGGLSLGVKDEPQGNFSVDGNVYIPVETWDVLRKTRSNVSLHVNFLDTNADFIGVGDMDVELNLTASEKFWGTSEMRVSVPKQRVNADGEYSRYPFDNYRFGVKSAKLRVSSAGDSSGYSIPLEVNLVPQLSSGFDALRPETTHQFMRKTNSIQGDIGDRSYSTEECPLIISRSPWFLMLAALLALVLLTPAVCLVYKSEADAGLELTTAIIGVATIRSFVLGTPTGWNFMPIDVFLAGVVVLTAMIPLWRLGAGPRKEERSSNGE